MTSAFRWAAMRAIVMFHSLWGTKSQDSVHRSQLLKGKESRSGIEPRSFFLPAYRTTPYRSAKPDHDWRPLWQRHWDIYHSGQEWNPPPSGHLTFFFGRYTSRTKWFIRLDLQAITKRRPQRTRSCHHRPGISVNFAPARDRTLQWPRPNAHSCTTWLAVIYKKYKNNNVGVGPKSESAARW